MEIRPVPDQDPRGRVLGERFEPALEDVLHCRPLGGVEPVARHPGDDRPVGGERRDVEGVPLEEQRDALVVEQVSISSRNLDSTTFKPAWPAPV